MSSIFSRAKIDRYSAVSDAWHPGIYIRARRADLSDPATMTRFIETQLANTAQLKGIKTSMEWALIETSPETFDWTLTEDHYNRVAALGKHFSLIFRWREFVTANGVSQILPADLQGDNGVDGVTGLTDYHYGWQAGVGSPINLKLWDKTLLARFERWIQETAHKFDKLPNFTQISTSETAAGGEPLIPVPGMTPAQALAEYELGMIAIMRMVKKYFRHSTHQCQTNNSREMVQTLAAIFEPEAMGCGCPNMNLANSLNTTGSPPGLFTYIPGLEGKVLIACEIQGLDMRASAGLDTSPDDYPSPLELFTRTRDVLKNNYTYVLTTPPYWETGGNGNESMLNHIQTDQTINAALDGSGGVVTARPSSLL